MLKTALKVNQSINVSITSRQKVHFIHFSRNVCLIVIDLLRLIFLLFNNIFCSIVLTFNVVFNAISVIPNGANVTSCRCSWIVHVTARPRHGTSKSSHCTWVEKTRPYSFNCLIKKDLFLTRYQLYSDATYNLPGVPFLPVRQNTIT